MCSLKLSLMAGTSSKINKNNLMYDDCGVNAPLVKDVTRNNRLNFFVIIQSSASSVPYG
jgi:hypothetical protein